MEKSRKYGLVEMKDGKHVMLGAVQRAILTKCMKTAQNHGQLAKLSPHKASQYVTIHRLAKSGLLNKVYPDSTDSQYVEYKTSDKVKKIKDVFVLELS